MEELKLEANPQRFQLQTTRLTIRPLTDRDRLMYCSLYTDPELMQFIAPVMTMEKAQQSFDIALRLSKQQPFKRLFLALYQHNLAVGMVGLSAVNPKLKQAEIGVLLAKTGRGQGFGQEALDAVCRLFLQLNPGFSLYTDIDPGNAAAQHMVLQVGFKPDSQNDRLFWRKNSN